MMKVIEYILLAYGVGVMLDRLGEGVYSIWA